MILDKLSLIYIICLCVMGMIAEVGYLFLKKEKSKSQMFEKEIEPKNVIVVQYNMFKKRFNESKFIKAYIAYLERQLDLTFDTTQTASMIFHRQKVLIFLGSGITLGSLLIFPFVLTLLILAGFLVVIFYPNLKFNSVLRDKHQAFDAILPTFIGKVLMTLEVGINIENSLAFGIRSVSHPLVKRELEKLIVEMKLHPDDISKAFLNLKNRMIGSSECEKFCNIVVSGIQNGNQMSFILAQERERLSDKQIKEIREQQESQSNIGTAITIVFIFIPALLLLLIPLMSSGGMY